jgi:hypothetical protein
MATGGTPIREGGVTRIKVAAAEEEVVGAVGVAGGMAKVLARRRGGARGIWAVGNGGKSILHVQIFVTN